MIAHAEGGTMPTTLLIAIAILAVIVVAVAVVVKLKLSGGVGKLKI